MSSASGTSKGAASTFGAAAFEPGAAGYTAFRLKYRRLLKELAGSVFLALGLPEYFAVLRVKNIKRVDQTNAIASLLQPTADPQKTEGFVEKVKQRKIVYRRVDEQDNRFVRFLKHDHTICL